MLQKTTEPEVLQKGNSSIDTKNKHIPLSKIVENMELTKSLTKTAAILNTTKQNIQQRLRTAGIDFTEYLDFKDLKPVRYEVMQSRLINSIDDADIKKSPLGSRVLAICQLEDKVRLIRGESTGNLAIHSDIQAIIQAQAGRSDDSKPLISLDTGIPQHIVVSDADVCDKPVIDL